MTKKKLIMFSLLMMISTESKSVNEKEPLGSVEELKFVLKILEERGFLNKVDRDLLNRIQRFIQKDKSEKTDKCRDIANDIEIKTTTDKNFLAKVKKRQEDLFGSRQSNRESVKTSLETPKERSQKKTWGDIECRKLRRENTRLRRQLKDVRSKLSEVNQKPSEENVVYKES